MREFIIGSNDAGQRLDRWLGKAVPLLPSPLAQKYIRLKRIKRNGGRTEGDTRLTEGDRIQLYINDEYFEAPDRQGAALTALRPRLDIVYEDENLLLLNKRPGQLSHPDKRGRTDTLITYIHAYLYQKDEWDPRRENSFAPSLCNRIDRNTGGIVIAAKNAESLRVINQKIKDREMGKYYLCVIRGRITPPKGRLKHILSKDGEKNQASVHTRPVPGGRTAVTLYRTVEYRNGLSLMECELITGRTHQIRAQFAAAGHPLLGDVKYGQKRGGTRSGPRYQALYSYKLAFSFTTDGGILQYLDGKSWTVEDIPFVREYFPAANIK